MTFSIADIQNIQSEESIEEVESRLDMLASRVFDLAWKIGPTTNQMLWRTTAPAKVVNRKFKKFSTADGKIILAGDTAGSGSPLAGLGASLGVSGYPVAVGNYIDDLRLSAINNQGRRKAVKSYQENVEILINTWHKKSIAVRNFIEESIPTKISQ